MNRHSALVLTQTTCIIEHIVFQYNTIQTAVTNTPLLYGACEREGDKHCIGMNQRVFLYTNFQ